MLNRALADGENAAVNCKQMQPRADLVSVGVGSTTTTRQELAAGVTGLSM